MYTLPEPDRSLHQLRSVIAQVGGDVAMTNQCGRLTANIIIAYNTILLGPAGIGRRRPEVGHAVAEDIASGLAACLLPRAPFASAATASQSTSKVEL
jgi:hypothetical protein